MLPRDVVTRWVELFNQANADGLAEFYHSEAINHQMPLEPVVGREEIRAMFRREFAAAEMVCIPVQILVDGDWAVLEWKDPKGLHGCGFFQISDGKILLQRGYWDRLSFHRLHNVPLPS